jgi:hypothetical protein
MDEDDLIRGGTKEDFDITDTKELVSLFMLLDDASNEADEEEMKIDSLLMDLEDSLWNFPIDWLRLMYDYDLQEKLINEDERLLVLREWAEVKMNGDGLKCYRIVGNWAVFTSRIKTLNDTTK